MTSRRDHGDGGIDQRGPDQWRLRWRVGRKRYSKAFHGTKRAAQAELRRIISEADIGAAVAPVKLTVRQHLRRWLDGQYGLSAKTRERYEQLVGNQINPQLGDVLIQALRPAQIKMWHGKLIESGLSTITVGNAHRALHRALQHAVEIELVQRNVAGVVRPPKPEHAQVEILSADQISDTLKRLRDVKHRLYPIIALALGTGMRRGEICALAWKAVDLEAGTVRVERSLEETDALRFKTPKTRAGIRTISLPQSVIDVLRQHRVQQNEHCLRHQLGRFELVFPLADGSPYPPDRLSGDWIEAVRVYQLPKVKFHALRHSHASALIAAGLDIVSVSQRLGHASPSITLSVYAHQFRPRDDEAAKAIDAVLS